MSEEIKSVIKEDDFIPLIPCYLTENLETLHYAIAN